MLREDLDQPLPGLGELRAGYLAGSINNNCRVSGEHAVRTNPAALVQAAGDEIRCFEADRVFVFARFAGDLAEDHIIALERGKDQGRPSLGLAQI